jgi:hypothetical protein
MIIIENIILQAKMRFTKFLKHLLYWKVFVQISRTSGGTGNLCLCIIKHYTMKAYGGVELLDWHESKSDSFQDEKSLAAARSQTMIPLSLKP